MRLARDGHLRVEARGVPAIDGRLSPGLLESLSTADPSLGRVDFRKAAGDTSLAARIERAIAWPGYAIRVLPGEQAPQLYGFAPYDYPRADPRQARQAILRYAGGELRQSLQHLSFGRDRQGRLTETFRMENPDAEKSERLLAVDLTFSYGRSTGWTPYEFSLSRTVLVCTNGMTQKQVQNSRWFHGAPVSFETLIRRVAGAFAEEHQLAEERRKRIGAVPLLQDRVLELVTRLNIADQTRLRVLERLASEVEDTGRNQWSLSQALTWLATRERAVARNTAEGLRAVGTQIFENGLEATLMRANHRPVEHSFAPGVILPESHSLVRTMSAARRSTCSRAIDRFLPSHESQTRKAPCPLQYRYN